MHSNRSSQIDAFLLASGWGDARRAPLAGDASFRRYERITDTGRQAVLMDAPPDKEDIRPFMQVANDLHAFNMSAPKLLAQDEANGFLLLEDLGDELFTRVLKKTPQAEEQFYLAAADVLVELYRHGEHADFQAYQPYDEALCLRETGLFSEWFLPAVGVSDNLPQEFDALWSDILKQLPSLRPTLVLRDYHADNLVWLPARDATRKVGLLDFQDAVVGSPAYDMVSFLEDARRDVSPHTVEKVITHYLAATKIDKADFMAAYALLGAQRNCKIIGIFTRLAVRDKKPHYLAYLPRVWGHLEKDMSHPLLAPLKQWLDKHIDASQRGIIEITTERMKAV